MPAVGPRADTKVVGCLRGGKTVNTQKDKSVSSISHAARFNEVKNLFSLPGAKGEDEHDSERQKTKNALVLFNIIGFQKECPLLGHVPTLR